MPQENQDKPEYPLIIHVPHASTFIPPEVRRGILLSDQDLETELLKMTDRYADGLTAIGDQHALVVKNEFSRLVVDPERFRNDNQEMTAPIGMGAVYTRTSENTF